MATYTIEVDGQEITITEENLDEHSCTIIEQWFPIECPLHPDNADSGDWLWHRMGFGD